MNVYKQCAFTDTNISGLQIQNSDIRGLRGAFPGLPAIRTFRTWLSHPGRLHFALMPENQPPLQRNS